MRSRFVGVPYIMPGMLPTQERRDNKETRQERLYGLHGMLTGCPHGATPIKTVKTKSPREKECGGLRQGSPSFPRKN